MAKNIVSAGSKQPAVYALYSTIEPLVYIGSTTNLATRFARHRSALRKSKHPNPELQKYFDEHGDGALEYIPLVYFDNATENLEQVLKDEEDRQLLSHVGRGFEVLNRNAVKAGSWCSDEYRKNASERAKKRDTSHLQSPEVRKKNAQAVNAFYQTPEGKVYLRELQEKSRTPEARAKAAEKVRAFYQTPEGKQKAKEKALKSALSKGKAVVLMDREGNETEYRSLSEAAVAIGSTPGGVSRVASGQRKATKGYRVRFA